MKFKTLRELQQTFRTEQDCINYLEKVIWNGEPISPYDPTSKVWKFANNQYRCKNTYKWFNVKTNTIFKRTHVPLPDWFLAIHLFISNKKGISSRQLARFLGIHQRTSWFMLHRIRRSLDIPLFKTMLKDFVEIDETFLGGSNKWRHQDKKVPRSQGRSCKDKTPVMGMLERGGNLICQVVPNTQQKTLEPIVFANVRENANVYTDEWLAYKDLGKKYNHQWVNHGAKQYVRGEVYTNSLEGFWSHLKRGIRGTYHQISRKHTQKYVDEFVFRYNTRKYGEQERFDSAILGSVGKQITYQQLINF